MAALVGALGLSWPACSRSHAPSIYCAPDRRTVKKSSRLAPLDLSDELPGSRIMKVFNRANINRMVVTKGKVRWLAYLDEFFRK
jgi:hypothetical protein